MSFIMSSCSQQRLKSAGASMQPDSLSVWGFCGTWAFREAKLMAPATLKRYRGSSAASLVGEPGREFFSHSSSYINISFCRPIRCARVDTGKLFNKHQSSNFPSEIEENSINFCLKNRYVWKKSQTNAKIRSEVSHHNSIWTCGWNLQLSWCFN